MHPSIKSFMEKEGIRIEPRLGSFEASYVGIYTGAFKVAGVVDKSPERAAILSYLTHKMHDKRNSADTTKEKEYAFTVWRFLVYISKERVKPWLMLKEKWRRALPYWRQ